MVSQGGGTNVNIKKMKTLKILNKKEIKQIYKILNNQYGFEEELDYAFLLRKKDDRIFLINKEFAKSDESKLRINSLGMYFGEKKKTQIRLSIEGAQLIGSGISKNIIEISDGLMKLWIHGHDIEFDCDWKGIIVVKNNNDYVGCGSVREGKVLNQIPKIRKLNTKE